MPEGEFVIGITNMYAADTFVWFDQTPVNYNRFPENEMEVISAELKILFSFVNNHITFYFC